MKSLKIKVGLMFALVAALFAGCSDDNDSNPVIPSTAPSSFTLNTPALANQNIEINADSKITLSWGAPNYTFPGEISYRVQVGLPQTDGSVKWETDDDGNALFVNDAVTTTTVDIDGEDLAEALCTIDGVKHVEDYVDMGSRRIAFRVLAYLVDAQSNVIDNTEVYSNTIYMNHLQSYCAVVNAGVLYIVGQPTGWQAPSEDNRSYYEENDYLLHETAPRSGIFDNKGTNTDFAAHPLPVKAGEFSLRFYKNLNGWGDDGTTDGVAAGAADANNEFTMNNGVYSGSYVAGKGNWVITNWTTDGNVYLTVDTNAGTVTFETVQ